MNEARSVPPPTPILAMQTRSLSITKGYPNLGRALRTIQNLLARLLAACSLFLAGCLLPEKFVCHLHVDQNQNFTFRYEGTMVHALLLSPGLTAKDKAESRAIAGEVAAELSKMPGIVSAKPLDNGRVSIVAEQRGRIRDQREPLFGSIHLRPGAGDSVRIEWASMSREEDIAKMDYHLDGEFKLTTDGVITSHNGVPGAVGMLDGALIALGLKSEAPMQNVAWHITRENYRTTPKAVIGSVAPKQTSLKAQGANIIFTSNVPGDDPAIKFATNYLRRVSKWEGDTILWQIWKDSFSMGFAANATWLHREIQELKGIDLQVQRRPLSEADKLNGKLDVFQVYVKPSAMRTRLMEQGVTYGAWNDPGELYQPLIMTVEQTKEGWSVICNEAIFGGKKYVALSPILDQLDPNLASVSYPVLVKPGEPIAGPQKNAIEEPAAGPRMDAMFQPRSSQNPSGNVAVANRPPPPTKLNLPPEKYQERRIQAFLALMYRDLEDGKTREQAWRFTDPVIYNGKTTSRERLPDLRVRRPPPPFIHFGKTTSREQMQAEQAAYQDRWTNIREAPHSFVIERTGPDSYNVSYMLHHWAEGRGTGAFFSGDGAMNLKIQAFADGEYFQITEWNSKVIDNQEGFLGTAGAPPRFPPRSVQARRFKGVARSPAYDWPFLLKINEPDSSGRFTGEITWTTLHAVHLVHGSWHGRVIFFHETEVLSPGYANIGPHYTAVRDENGLLQGTWSFMDVPNDTFEGGVWEMRPD